MNEAAGPKQFKSMDNDKLWKVLREMGTLDQDHLTCLLRNLYVGQEAIRALYKRPGWFSVEKGERQSSLLSPCLFNLYAEHIMRNARLDELQATIKTGRRNINNLNYADDTTLMAESEEPLEGEEEAWKNWLKINIKKKRKKKTLRSWHPTPYFMANRRGKAGSSDRFPLLELQNHCGQWLQPWIKRRSLLARKTMTNKHHIKKQRHPLCRQRSA